MRRDDGVLTVAPLGPVKDKSVAVVGVGELGHLAVRMAAAMGAEVTAVSRSTRKHADARRLGAAHVLEFNGPDGLGGSRDRFDLILNTFRPRSRWTTTSRCSAPAASL